MVEVKKILGEHLICEAPLAEDQKRNTDLCVINMQPLRIGVRIRDHRYLHQFGDEFTIRQQTFGGGKTELSKIIEGYGDYFFYGFTNEDKSSLSQWRLLDLKVFRLSLAYKLQAQQMPTIKQNVDGSSNFCAFKYVDFPQNLIVAESANTSLYQSPFKMAENL